MKRALLGIGILALIAAAVPAVQPTEWTQHTEAEFDAAERKDTVVDSHGDVTLAHQVDLLVDSKNAPAVISCLAAGDGGKSVFIGSGVDGKILRFRDGKTETLAILPAAVVTCLTRVGNGLLAGGGGTHAGLFRIDRDGNAEKMFSHDDVQYIWDILPEGKTNSLYLATGPKAKVFKLAADGKAEEIYDGAKLVKNILCLAAGPDGKLYAGTDEKGLVLEIDPAKKTGRVLYDAEEKEISAILVDKNGLFVSTNDTSLATGEITANGVKNGKTEKSATQPATAPKPSSEEAPAKTPTPKAAPTPAAPKAKDAAATTQQARAHIRSDGKLVLPMPAGKTPPSMVKDGKTYYLLRSRKTGKVSAVPVDRVVLKPTPAGSLPTPVKASGSSSSGSSGPASAAAPSGKGNAVYFIDKAGMVRALFRRPVAIEDMIRQGDRLLLATGPKGQLIYVTLDGSLIGQALDVDAKTLSALLPMTDGSLLFATSNAGSLGRLGSTFVTKGSLTCKPLDAKQIATFGTIRLAASTPPGTSLTVATRSGNVAEPDDNTWSDWSREMPCKPGYLPIGSPAGRFFQFRVTMTSPGKVSPTLGRVAVIYQVGNLPPVISAIDIKAVDKAKDSAAPNQAFRQINLKTDDPNKDKLIYSVFYRPVDTTAWVELTDDLKEPQYFWDTRTVEDGRFELKIVASDTPTNLKPAALKASRVSEPVTVDNTAPKIKNFTAIPDGKQVIVNAEAADAMSRITAMSYAVDSAKTWHTLVPTDGLFDSMKEEVTFQTDKLKSGAHRIIIRTTDAYGNTGYTGKNVVVK